MKRRNSTELAESLQQHYQQQKQHSAASTAAFKRLLSLQRTSSRSQRHRRQDGSGSSVAVTPLDLAPPALPPRGHHRPRRHRSGSSEFSAIVLDVNRLFSDSGRDAIHRRGMGDVDGYASDVEDDDDSDDDREEDRRSVFSAGGSDGSAEVVDEETEKADAAREAAAEIQEADDVYMEIPLRTAAVAAALPHGFGRRAALLQRLSSSASVPSRALLETLETLKTPTIPGSDPESPVYTTDCGGEERPPGSCHLQQQQRLCSVSSLMPTSAGEDGGSYVGVARLDHPRWAPSTGSHHLMSAPEPHQTGRLSYPSRRHSVVSQTPSGAAAVRKASRASRAVKLDYQFNSSSGKASLQKLGTMSLTTLEDMAQVGGTEQGTNFKRSYVSIYRPLHPLFLTLKLFGVFHTRQSGGKAAAKFTKSYIYSGLVMLALWFNVLRYLAVYDWGLEKFGSLLFLKLTHHVLYIQAAVASTVMFRASGSFPHFFKACHEFMSRRHNLTYQYTLHTRAKATALMGCAVVLLELGVFMSWMVQADSEYFRTFLRPYTYVVPWSDASKGVLGFCHFAFDVYMAAAWVFPALLFCSFTWLFEREFRFLAHRLRLACTNDHIFVGDIEKFRLESWKISKLVAKFDAMFSFYVFTVFITDILGACLILYNLIAGSFPGNGIIVEVWFWLVSALVRLFGVTISAARVNQAACSPLNIIQNMNLREYAVNPAKIGQLMIFLNKLTIGNIGFTAWNLFTLSRTSTMTIAAMIVTYTVLFVKLGASYGQTEAATGLPPTSAATDPLLTTAAAGY